MASKNDLKNNLNVLVTSIAAFYYYFGKNTIKIIVFIYIYICKNEKKINNNKLYKKNNIVENYF